MADQVAELKREVETLRALLEHERKKSVSATVISLNAPEPVSLSPVKPLDTQGAQSPRAFMKSPSKARSQRFDPQPQQQQSLGDAEWNEPPVGTKRGKWWLQDRQILSRNAPTRRDDCVAVKVREAWVWNGRPVIVDKIVMCAMPVPHHDVDEQGDSLGILEEQHRIQPLTPSAVASFQQLELNKQRESSASAASRSPTRPFRAADQPSSASAAVDDGCSPVDESAAAALRLESEMRSHQAGI